MKILHVPFGYFPDPVGGTEIYVAGLVNQLVKMGLQNVIAAPGTRNEAYLHSSIPVHRFAVSSGPLNLRALYGEGDESAAREFARILRAERPAIVHLHAFTSAVSLQLVRLAKERGCTVVFTFHTPTTTCARGTLLRRTAACDGVLETRRCATCVAEGWGLNHLFASLLGSVPVGWGQFLGRQGLQGGPYTALRCSELIELRHQAIRDLFNEVDQVIAVCEWVKQLLIRNQVPCRKIALSRQGVPIKRKNGQLIERVRQSSGHSPQELSVICLGRFHPSKGFHTLVEAFRRSPDLSMRLEILGVAQDKSGITYEQRLKHAASNDPRIHFRHAVSPSQTSDLLQDCDLVAIPSQVLETGPLVALEAFAAGTPVIGSNLGGVAEIVRDGVDGILVEPHSVNSWGAALRRCVVEPELLQKLRKGVRPPRTMDHVAREMAALYRNL